MARRGRPPTTGITPIRNIRVPDELWHAAKAATTAQGETVTDVVTRALRRYVARHDRR